MRILMLSWEYPPRIVGGISRVVHDLAQKLGERGNEVHVITCHDQGTKDMELDGNVYVHRVYPYSINTNNFIDWVLQLNFSMIERCINTINIENEFDIIHAHDWIVAFAARVLKHSYFTPLISTIHATESGRNWGIHNETQRYINDVEWWLTYESWRVIVNSVYMKNETKNLFGISENKIAVIPNGIDINKFDICERDLCFRRKYAADGEKIVFFVGRLVNEKGAHILINAIPKILKYYYDVKFVIAGKGPMLEHLKNLTAEMNISQKVYLTGYISDSDLSKLYKCADIAVFPSLYEPFGIVALEGMVAKVPVVVSDIGGIGEIVCHRIDGMKSYAGNANSLADSILELLLNPEMAERIRNKAFEKAANIYNWDVISEQVLEVYEGVLVESRKDEWKNTGTKRIIEEFNRYNSN